MPALVKRELLTRVRNIVSCIRTIRVAGVAVGLEVGDIERDLAEIEAQLELCIDDYQAALYHAYNHPRNEQPDANGLLGVWQTKRSEACQPVRKTA